MKQESHVITTELFMKFAHFIEQSITILPARRQCLFCGPTVRLFPEQFVTLVTNEH